jgi:iron complex transport system ATP-binding protein
MPLEAKELRFGYRAGRRVLGGVSWRFAEGKITAVIGPNGAGKSTLLRLLLGVLRPEEGGGSVELDGCAVAGMKAAERAKRIAYIPQRTSPAFGFTLRECVAMGGLARGGAGQDEIHASLVRVGLADRAHEPFDSLSAGQQQKAVLARCLVQLRHAAGVPVLLADEPASALDPAHTLEAMTILREVAGGGGSPGATVVVVMHDLPMAARFCDEAVVLGRDGRLAAAGEAAQVLRPEVLDGVFGVRFARGGGGALVAERVL